MTTLFVCLALLAVAGGLQNDTAVAASPPAPKENPKRDVEALKRLHSVKGLLQLPDATSEAEKAHNRAFDRHIAPVLNRQVDINLARKLKEADAAADKDNFDAVLAIRNDVEDKIARKLIDWLLLRRGLGTIEQYVAFLEKNTDWPNRWRLIEHLEDKLYQTGTVDQTRRAFRNIEPETALGTVALAVAEAAAGQEKEARAIVKKLWRNGRFSKTAAAKFKERLGGLLDPADEAFRDKKREANNDSKWSKTRSKAYTAMRKKSFRSAYKIVTGIDGLSVNPRNEQSFLAGWLALRYLKDTKAAIRHFTRMTKDADGPLTRSKSGYWMGRAHEAAGNSREAKKFYRQAFERQQDTFHAHLARLKLEEGPLDIAINPPAAPSEKEIEAFRKSDAVAAAVMADRSGLGRNISRPFVANLGNLAESEGAVALVAHLTRELGDTQQSLRIAKKGIARGFNLYYYGYPLHAFPDYKPLREPPEPAFMLSIARQESEFNAQIISSAGARGILQVMPITARHVCRDYKIKCNIQKLILDESYNTKISSAYIADRMEEFGGSYVLGLAGYNAGPGRARQWIKQFGDPRDARIDAIDWIERIPFRETRKYVAKVLSNIQMYRARLGEERPLRLMEDLARAKSSRRAGKTYPPGARGLRLTSGQ